MWSSKSIAQNLMQAAIVNLLLIVSCWAQKPQGAQSAVPPLPADIPGNADRYSVLIMGNLAGQQAVWTAPDASLHIYPTRKVSWLPELYDSRTLRFELPRF